MPTMIAAFLLTLGSLVASTPQAPPNVAGRWVYAGDRSTPPATDRANFGLEFEARLDAKAFTVERTAGTQKTANVYPLDGSEMEIKTAAAVTKTRARIEGGKLVMEVTTVSNPNAAGISTTTVSTRQIWVEGETLVSEWAIKSPRPSTTVSLYKRPSD